MFIRDVNMIPSTAAGACAFLAMYGGEEITIGVNNHLVVITPAGNDTWEIEADGDYLGLQGVNEVAQALVSIKKQVIATQRYNAYKQYTQPRPQKYPRMDTSLPGHRCGDPYPEEGEGLLETGARLIGQLFPSPRRYGPY